MKTGGPTAARITPAYAGTTFRILSVSFQFGDHPRLRGNHGAAVDQISVLVGSPPLTREPRSVLFALVVPGGITPAYAGTTDIEEILDKVHRDHPRLRGNHPHPWTFICPGGGSPPLTREPHTWFFLHSMKSRITPAYAGTTDKRSLKINIFAFQYCEKH